jgi:hypothetical protein
LASFAATLAFARTFRFATTMEQRTRDAMRRMTIESI